ncbi:pro-resilin-like [Amphibalanus amphitrite]|uniref:pro-resilin-like n=1 Tax=Amphibalanus amphitrite TaxID=1232801 RepID=UPI001C921541|nr:pro-resilin-like [Amphibalanus amphitrite]
MKFLVLAALAAVAAADQSGASVYRYGTSAGTQSRYTLAASSAGYGLKSRRRPFEPTLKPLNGGYSRQNGRAGQNYGAYNSQANEGSSSQTNGGLSQSNGGYYSQTTGDSGASSIGGYSSSAGLYSSQSSGGGGRRPAARYTPRYGGTLSARGSALARARPEPTPAPQPYSFSYDVLDVFGNDYGAAEASNGEQVQGQYSVLLPDGRLQTVSYAVDGDSGFVADVQYEGEARFPDAAGGQQGRGSVTSGSGPGASYRYGRN